MTSTPLQKSDSAQLSSLNSGLNLKCWPSGGTWAEQCNQRRYKTKQGKASKYVKQNTAKSALHEHEVK